MAGHDDQQFRCEVQVRRAAVRIGPVGELDIATVPIVEDQLALCAASGLKQLTLDLRSLSFLDATGLRLILLWNTKSRTGSFTFSVIAGSPAVQQRCSISPTHASRSTSSICLRARRDFVSAPRASATRAPPAVAAREPAQDSAEPKAGLGARGARR